MEQPAATVDAKLLAAFPHAPVFAVGGRVRDELLASIGKPQEYAPDLDYLICGVPLDELLRRLEAVGRAELVGASFGVIKLTLDGTTVDVALPRRERSTGTHHRDFQIESGPDIPIEEDLRRRDFRMNMMARDLRSGEIIDPFSGRRDLENGVLDIVSAETFVEDPLRILRGAQFAARFELRPSEMALRGMRDAAELIPTVAPERISDELYKLLTRAQRPSIGFELLREVSALHAVLPELMEGWQIEQNEFHRYTVYYHSLACCDAAPQDFAIRLAALLHDIGKPRTKEGPHFYRHEFVGADMARQALTRLRLPSETIQTVTHLITHHMFKADDELTDAAVRRFIRRVGPGNIDALFTLRHADVSASGLPERDRGEHDRFEERVRRELVAAPPFGVKDLCIGGERVIEIMKELGIAPPAFQGDARVGDALRHCLEIVLDEPRKNDPTALSEAVRKYFLEVKR